MWPSHSNKKTTILSSLVAGLLIASASCLSETDSESKPSLRVTDQTLVHNDQQKGTGPCATGDSELYATHPFLCDFLDRLEANADEVALEMTEFAREQNLLVGEQLNYNDSRAKSMNRKHFLSESDSEQLPVVFAHGMGDSCFNDGMIHIGNHTSEPNLIL